jgi:hypothetical protein
MAKVRSNVEAKSELPLFKVKASEDFPDWLLVTCTREACPSQGMHFLVKRDLWLAELRSTINPEVVLVGRACPYCFASSRIPGRRKARG